MIIYLNSTDQAAQDTALVAAEVCQTIEQPVLDADGNPTYTEVTVDGITSEVPVTTPLVVPIYGYTVDTIGIIYNTTDPLNPVPTVGWFANIMGEFSDEQIALLQPTAVPNNPVRMFAGAGK
jgi:hypothetical protein